MVALLLPSCYSVYSANSSDKCTLIVNTHTHTNTQLKLLRLLQNSNNTHDDDDHDYDDDDDNVDDDRDDGDDADDDGCFAWYLSIVAPCLSLSAQQVCDVRKD